MAGESYQQRRISMRRRANAGRIGKAVDPARTMTAMRLVRNFENSGRPDLARRAVNVVGSRSQRVRRTQPRFGDGGGGGRRIIEKAAPPTGPAKKAPTVARAGGAQPKRGLVATQSMPTIASQPMMPQLGTLPASQVVPMRKARVGKADRYFDPEDRRQRRLGAAGAGSALVGADQVRRGVQSTRRATRSLGGAKKIGEYLAEHGTKSRGDERALVNLAHNVERGGMLLNPRAAARIAGGGALVAGAGLLLRSAGDPRRRRWN